MDREEAGGSEDPGFADERSRGWWCSAEVDNASWSLRPEELLAEASLGAAWAWVVEERDGEEASRTDLGEGFGFCAVGEPLAVTEAL